MHRLVSSERHLLKDLLIPQLLAVLYNMARDEVSLIYNYKLIPLEIQVSRTDVGK